MNTYTLEPLTIELAVPNGAYEVTVNIKAHNDTVFTIYSQHRSFVDRDVEIEKNGEYTKTFSVSVCDRHFNGAEYEKVPGIKLQIATDGDITATAAASPVEIPTVYICGDSTVTDQPAEYPYSPTATYCGWGQAFTQLIKPSLAVSNHAQSGSCTTEFMASNLTAFENKIKEGDFMVIEFGHNDQKLKELDAFGGYKKNLIKLADIARSRGAKPIICSPINRIIFEPDGSLLNLLGDYRDAAKQAAEELGCTFIDMWQRTTDYFVTAGPVKAPHFFRHLGEERDYTHTNDIGGTMIARFFAQEMVKQNGPLAEFINEDLIAVEQVYADPGDKLESSEAADHIKTVGLVNVPADFDADITGLQI
ncbi:MAG: GDSL-type esterase/lipase family protein [Candidatus Ornithomonoglobus sp.]